MAVEFPVVLREYFKNLLVNLATIPGPYSNSSLESLESEGEEESMASKSSSKEDDDAPEEDDDLGDSDAPDPPEEP